MTRPSARKPKSNGFSSGVASNGASTSAIAWKPLPITVSIVPASPIRRSR